MPRDFFAHTPGPDGKWHPLVDHLVSVAERARAFAEAFNAGDLAYWIGLWHDVGKFNPQFQAYLRACEANPKARGHGPDHKAAGTLLAMQNKLGLAAMLVQGHHGGLRTPNDLKGWLAERSKDPAVAEALSLARNEITELDPPAPVSIPAHAIRDPHAAEIFLRLLFSALVDADFLDTERHFQNQRAALRGADRSIAELWTRFERYYRERFPNSPMSRDTVGQARRAIYEACLAAAHAPPGLFRLAVPTGGGKTLSGMAFALRHALHHGHRRIIVAVPFISITEQTADVYRDVFRDDTHDRPVVLEHHSAAWEDSAFDEDFHPEHVWARLAAENWDAPIIVTTTVQLFESLFSNSTSRVRKLHRLARSVILLDEAQALPRHLLAPILDVLGQLCRHYGTSVVISTATQPAFEAIPEFATVPATDLVSDPQRYFASLKRVAYEWRIDPPLAWDEIAEIVRGESQALVVVNTKKDAFALLDALDDPEALHLSTSLCGAHRRWVIDEVKRRLSEAEPCRLVSTQVIEAGVDLDFPLVLRAVAPLDAIIQAAGRCNREGRRASGRVIVFQPDNGGYPSKPYKAATDLTLALFARGDLDPHDPAAAREYFERLFRTFEVDREQIQELRRVLDYPRVAEAFRMIDDDTEHVVVLWGSEEERHRVANLCEQLRQGGASARQILRQLQPYLVSVYAHQADDYRRRGLIAPVVPGVGQWLGTYHPVRGLTGEGPDPDALVI